jgi:hypothetical protein
MAQVLVSLLLEGAIVGAVDAVMGACVVVSRESCLLPPKGRFFQEDYHQV